MPVKTPLLIPDMNTFGVSLGTVIYASQVNLTEGVSKIGSMDLAYMDSDCEKRMGKAPE